MFRNNKKIIEELNKLPLFEQLIAYKRLHPESYLIEKDIENKKEEIRNSSYLKK